MQNHTRGINNGDQPGFYFVIGQSKHPVDDDFVRDFDLLSGQDLFPDIGKGVPCRFKDNASGNLFKRRLFLGDGQKMVNTG